ncbi:AAEL017485-PA [Aedes aegypti]|uniref:AAEL017485-PA n=1 Tax=Aedes aegypti TaxID=7159 RepID=J9HYA5_AEDAE|nr:AAEL017485-PA [Aedes aegypti]
MLVLSDLASIRIAVVSILARRFNFFAVAQRLLLEEVSTKWLFAYRLELHAFFIQL